MRILVTNDDGFDAPGLAALQAAAGDFGEVTLFAPATQQSYVGHRVSTHTPLRLTELAPGQFHLEGTPADCVRVALRGLNQSFDWVLSGINHGGNLGADVYTSGTVAAAREAALLGVPAIAISQFHRRPHPDDWPTSIALAKRAIQKILAAPPNPGDYWNVNLPHPISQPHAVALIDCDIDPGPLDVAFTRQGEEFLYSGRYMARSASPGLDVDHCFAGAITITRFRTGR